MDNRNQRSGFSFTLETTRIRPWDGESRLELDTPGKDALRDRATATAEQVIGSLRVLSHDLEIMHDPRALGLLRLLSDGADTLRDMLRDTTKPTIRGNLSRGKCTHSGRNRRRQQ